MIGDDDEEEEEDEFGGQETLVTARPSKAESEFSQQDTLVIREDQPRVKHYSICLLYTSPSPRDATLSRMPSSA